MNWVLLSLVWQSKDRFIGDLPHPLMTRIRGLQPVTDTGVLRSVTCLHFLWQMFWTVQTLSCQLTQWHHRTDTDTPTWLLWCTTSLAWHDVTMSWSYQTYPEPEDSCVNTDGWMLWKEIIFHWLISGKCSSLSEVSCMVEVGGSDEMLGGGEQDHSVRIGGVLGDVSRRWAGPQCESWWGVRRC